MSDALTRVYGIDLGTTYSAIAYVDEHGKPVVVPNGESERITPSWSSSTARASSSATRPRRPPRSSRTGSSPGSSSTWATPTSSSSTRARATAPRTSARSSSARSSATPRSALGGGEPITDVVITCPAYFGTDEREATANAGRLAGLNVRAILNEPTAAAIAYGLEQADDQTVLVYDLGGGTFDVTMIEIKDRLIRVICTGGDHRLGGALWDEAIVMYLCRPVPDPDGRRLRPDGRPRGPQ